MWLPLAHPVLGACPVTQARALTGSQTCDPLVHRPALHPLSHSRQGAGWFLELVAAVCLALYACPPIKGFIRIFSFSPHKPSRLVL